MFFKLHNTAMALKAWSKKTVGSVRLELYMPNDIIHQLDVAQETCNYHLMNSSSRKS
jgi:hypothetical protein